MRSGITEEQLKQFPTLRLSLEEGRIHPQQLINFLEHAGLEIKAPRPNHGLDKQFRLELAVSYLNTFLKFAKRRKTREDSIRWEVPPCRVL